MLSSSTATREPIKFTASPLEVQDDSQTRKFIVDYESWLLGQFRTSLRTALSGTTTPSELLAGIRPWVDELSQDFLYSTSSSEAAKLRDLFNETLDDLEHCYWGFSESAAGMMLALSPLEDILVWLSRRAKASERNSARWSA